MQFTFKVLQHLHLKNVISLQKIQMFLVSDPLASTGSAWPQFDGKTRTESVFLKKRLSNPLKKGHCNQRCTTASSRSLPHPALLEVHEDFLADFVRTDSSPPLPCLCFPSPFCRASSKSRTQFNKFRPGRLQNKYSYNKQVVVKG